MINLIKKAWAALTTTQPNTDTLEGYIRSKEPSTIGDVEFWTREYDNRQRMINSAVRNGEIMAANWIRRNY